MKGKLGDKVRLQHILDAAALKQKPEKTFTVEEARAYSKKLIRKWASEE
jgi:hypothetical protein